MRIILFLFFLFPLWGDIPLDEVDLPLSGEIREINGFVYVDISDDYIHTLIPYIEAEGFESPPYFGPDLAGAHITLTLPGEEISSFPLGKTVSFTLKECQIVGNKYFIIVVDSPELEKIRTELGLLPLPLYPFHITIGILP